MEEMDLIQFRDKLSGNLRYFNLNSVEETKGNYL